MERAVDLGGGATVHTSVDGSGPPVVLCHGGPGLWDYTGGLAALLEDRFAVHRWHQRGCGPSAPVAAYGLDVAVADVQALRAAWGVDRPWAVVGHSWGAYLALLTALRHPATTAAVVYVSGTGAQSWWRASGSAAHRAGQADRLTDAQRGRLAALDAMPDRDLDEERELRLLSWLPDLAPGTPASALDEMVSAPHAIRFDINRSLIPPDDDAALLADVERCEVPFLVVHGGEDTRPSDGARQLAARLPNATFHLVDGAGHLPWVERPDEVRAVITSFLAAVIG